MFVQVRKELCASSPTETYHLEEAIRIAFDKWMNEGGDKVTQTTDLHNAVEIEEFDTLDKIVNQLESCNYECEAGPLKNNIAFISLKKMS